VWRLLVTLAACGRAAFAPLDDAPRADTPTPLDAQPTLGPWSAPTLVGELASPSADDDPTLTDDQLEIYFNSNRAGGLGNSDIWMATRSTTTDPFGAITNVAELNSIDLDSTPEVSGDGLTIYFSSTRPGGLGNKDIWLATRPTRATAWSSPVHVVELSSPDAEGSASVDPTGTTVFFDSVRNNGTVERIHSATRPDLASPWTIPVVRDDLVGANGSQNPFIDTSLLAIWFNHDAGSGHDIYIATRATATEPFTATQPVVGVNSNSNDSDPWVSRDGRVMYLTSNRSGDEEIYRATR
jgi:Tol biopolymer transport system component